MRYRSSSGDGAWASQCHGAQSSRQPHPRVAVLQQLGEVRRGPVRLLGGDQSLREGPQGDEVCARVCRGGAEPHGDRYAATNSIMVANYPET
jgi:hypothetical protein